MTSNPHYKNQKGYILDYIKEHGNEWYESFLIDYPDIDIKVDESNHLYIFTYRSIADFSDPINSEARGIILDLTHGPDNAQIVCWPFRKFHKIQDPRHDEIDWSTAVVTEKMDGSLIKVWYNHEAKHWVVSSNGMIYAKDAVLTLHGESGAFNSLYDIFMEIYKNSELYMYHDNLSKDYTYMFELCSKYNHVCIHYEGIQLYALSKRNNITGKESRFLIEKDYNIEELQPPFSEPNFATKDGYIVRNVNEINLSINPSLLEDFLLNMVEHDFNNTNGRIDSCTKEGVVVHDKNYNRVKIKSPIFMVIHGLFSGNSKMLIQLIKYIYNNEFDLAEIAKDFTDEAYVLYYYAYQVTRFKTNLVYYVNMCKNLYAKLKENPEINPRKELAVLISKEDLSQFGFKYLESNLTDGELLNDIDMKTVAKFVKPFEDFSEKYDVQNKYRKVNEIVSSIEERGNTND